MDVVQINIPKELFTELVMDGILKEEWLTDKYKNIEIFEGDDIHFNLLIKIKKASIELEEYENNKIKNGGIKTKKTF